jgi:hypothetical protein
VGSLLIIISFVHGIATVAGLGDVTLSLTVAATTRAMTRTGADTKRERTTQTGLGLLGL